jgi:hypothetical protein
MKTTEVLRRGLTRPSRCNWRAWLEQLAQYVERDIAEARAAGLEEAARLVDRRSALFDTEGWPDGADEAAECAAGIRALALTAARAARKQP